MFQQHSRLSNSDDDSGCALEEYAWCPPGLKAEQVRQFFKCLPEDKVPFLNSLGEKYRTKMLEEQLPPHDSDPKYCRSLNEEEKNELRIFSEQQRHNALGRGSAKQLSLTQSPIPCRGCEKLIESGSMCVFAERAGRTGLWHPQCFICKQCKEFLVNLIYFYKDGQLYCGRHHAELYKPRCTACDEIIFSDECTEAEGFSWHMDHFCCSNCRKRLGGERYVMRQSQPYCLNCFETMYAEYCDTCGERIETDQPQMAHESQHWHATDACFYCYTCRIPLHNRGFFPRYGALFCSNECALQRNSRCTSTKLIQQTRLHQSPDIIPTSYIYRNQHVRVIPARPRTVNHQQSLEFYHLNRNSKDTNGYMSDGAGIQNRKREYHNGYLSDGSGGHRYYRRHQPQAFVQYQTSPNSTLTSKNLYERRKLTMTRSRSREPIQFYNDLNLEQLDRHGATLEIARCSSSKPSRASLPDLSRKETANSKTKPYPTVSQETLVDQTTNTRNSDSDQIMCPISRPRSTTCSTASARFPLSRSLNGSSRVTKNQHVRFVDDDKTIYKYAPNMNCKSKNNATRRPPLSSSSSSSDEDNEPDDIKAIYQQFDIHGNRIKKPMYYGTKISYVDGCDSLKRNMVNPVHVKKSGISDGNDKTFIGTRRKKDCIIS